LLLLVANGINVNITKTSIKCGRKVIYIGDGGIDLFGKFKQLHYIIQAKYRTDETLYVSPKDLREFAAVLMEQPEGTVGFFVSNAPFSTRSKSYASNSKMNIILCDENDLVEKIKEAQLALLENSNNDDICIEDISTEEGVSTDIFGIKFNGKIRIGRISSKRNRESTNPY
jgi:hypothetical protein